MFRFAFLILSWCAAASAQPAQPAAAAPPPDTRPRLESAARRNENVQVNRIDNEAVKEANVRLGDDVTFLLDPAAEANFWAAEHGRPPAELPLLRPVAPRTGVHGEAFWSHQNSLFNARTFFQVGPVKPSRRNQYGARFAAGPLSGNFSQRKVRGMVNGNVLAPLASERTPLATDPAVRAVVSRFLAAYPAGLPNRPDFDPRALNTNAPQRIDETDGDLRLDRDGVARGRVSAFYAASRQRVDAFQLVAGQNPDMEIHAHRARLTWRRQLAPDTELAVGAAFNRVKSLLVSEPNAVGPRVRLGFVIEELGPDSLFPIDRAQNSFRYSALVARQAAGGRHALTFGGDLTRFQLNGVESNNRRGYFQFTSNFGRSALENFRLGVPSVYEVTIGELARGFRNWSANAFVGDKWRVTSRLQLYIGLRYNLAAAPVEVDGLTRVPYGCDCNNFSPRFSIAYDLRGWVLRTGYTASFGEILPVTYQQVRNNPPLVRYLQVQNPNLLDPLRGIDLKNGRTSPTVVASDLVSPYAHQYNFAIERRLASGWMARAAYIGSRSFKLLNAFVMNRAVPDPLVPLTTATVDQRRPDPRYFEVRNIVNAGIAYLDAAQFTLELPGRRGFTGTFSYTFGKAIDEGVDFSSTGANNDLLKTRNQSQYEAARDRKALSLFDSTHAAVARYSYDLPHDWQLSGVTTLKSGTPLTLFIGSDAPGFGNVDGSPSDRPNILDPSILGRTISDPNTAPLILRRDRFSFIRPGELRGNLGRGTFRKSPIANFNLALTKRWHWGGSAERTLLFRAEAYNLTNHPQFDEPQRNYSAPAFGKITNTLNDGRVFQFGLRLVM